MGSNMPSLGSGNITLYRLNAEEISARTILYSDRPKNYTWNHNKWQLRKRILGNNETDDDCASDMIGRIPVIGLSAHQNDLYYLRMLLYHQVGATCYAYLCTVDGEEIKKRVKMLACVCVFSMTIRRSKGPRKKL